MKIEIVPYCEEWAALFQEEKQRLERLEGLHAEAIEHVGSTSVPGQAAKPVVDIFVGVTTLLPLEAYKSLLAPPRYMHTPTDMQGRWLFGGYENGIWRYNIHLLPIKGFYSRTEFVIRDFLCKHPDYVAEYATIKQRCAGDSVVMEEYTRAKTAFLQKAYDAANEELGRPKCSVWEGDNNPLGDVAK